MVQFGRTLDLILIILGSIFLLLTTVALCVGVCLYRQRQKSKRRSVPPVFDSSLSPQHLVYAEKRENNGEAASTKRVHRPDRIVIPTISEHTISESAKETHVNPRLFANKVAMLKRNEMLLLYDEFEALNRQTHSHVEKKTLVSEQHMRRNRFPDVLTFDHNRVRLLGREEHDDYINASYIRSFDDTYLEFIAAQGPIGPPEPVTAIRENTIAHFWEMIWQEQITTLVMLTQTIEHLKLKCAQYWPEEVGTSKEYGGIRVEWRTTTEYATATMRSFDVTRNGQKRVVTQFHFEDWLDAKGPESTQNLLDLVLKIREFNKEFPILVHCSAGIGRTGVFIALWQLISSLESDPEGSVDVFGRVKKLREQRIRMVQSAEQYSSLYEAFLLYLRRKRYIPELHSISSLSEDSRYEVQEVSAI